MLQREITLFKLLEEELELLKEKGEKEFCMDSGWCVYGKSIDLSLKDKCIIDEYPDYDDDDNEIMPDYVNANDYELVYRDEMIQDVIITSYNQKNNCTIQEIYDSLVYYDQHDSFMVLN